MAVVKKTPEKSLYDYIEGYGNTCNSYSLVAVRFKRRILWTDLPYKCFEEVSENLLLVSSKILKNPDNLHHLKLKDPSVLSVFGGQIRLKQEPLLLLSMLSEALGASIADKILEHKFHKRVLYALVRGNIPKTFMKINRSNVFSIVLDTIRSCHYERAGYRHCENLRWLKRNKGCSIPATRFSVDFWHSFYPFVVTLLEKKCIELFGSPPCSRLGNILFKAQKKFKELLLENHDLLPAIEKDFYVCEITFERDELVGIRYRTREGEEEHGSLRRVVEYVSPMIVTFTDREYMDNCQQKTNSWIPLFRSTTWWKRRGFNVFVSRLKKNMEDLRGILEWLANQSSEKYKNIMADLTVLKMLFLERT